MKVTAEEKWRRLRTFVTGYIVFNKIDIAAGELVLADMDLLDAAEEDFRKSSETAPFGLRHDSPTMPRGREVVME